MCMLRRSDGSRDRLRVCHTDDVMILTQGDKEIRARLHSSAADNLPQNEANRAFTVRLTLIILLYYKYDVAVLTQGDK